MGEAVWISVALKDVSIAKPAEAALLIRAH
jgi:hypothetical protein